MSDEWVRHREKEGRDFKQSQSERKREQKRERGRETKRRGSLSSSFFLALSNVFVASLAGGYRDWLVDSDSADLISILGKSLASEHYLFSHTLAVPEVWMEQDHLVRNRQRRRYKRLWEMREKRSFIYHFFS